VADGNQEARADEHMGFAEAHVVVDVLRGMHGDEEGAAEGLDLGPLVRVLGVFDGELVQAEFLLQLKEQDILWFVQSDPDEAAVIDRQHVTDCIQADVAPHASGVIRRAVDDGGGNDGRGLIHRAILHRHRIAIKPYCEPRGPMPMQTPHGSATTTQATGHCVAAMPAAIAGRRRMRP
jgi:hypothetical protein